MVAVEPESPPCMRKTGPTVVSPQPPSPPVCSAVCAAPRRSMARTPPIPSARHRVPSQRPRPAARVGRDAHAERLRPTTNVRKASNSKRNNILKHARKDCDNTSWWILREFGSIALVVFAFVLLNVRRTTAGSSHRRRTFPPKRQFSRQRGPCNMTVGAKTCKGVCRRLVQ